MIPGISIIGERINPGFSSSRVLIERRDIPALQTLAREQVAKGASELNINLGTEGERDPLYVAEVIRAIQAAVDVPLSLDSPAAHVQKIAQAAYDPQRARGRQAMLNSVAETRWELMSLRRTTPFRVLLMASERMEAGGGVANRSGQEVHATARRLMERAVSEHPDLSPGDITVDVSLCPIASDTENSLRTALDGLAAMNKDRAFSGIRRSVGLSNLGIMLPAIAAANGEPLKLAVENAFLTMAVALGLDTLLATAGRGYRLLPPDDPVLEAMRAIVAADGYEALIEVRRLYAGAVKA
jgi:cobalamin-dependent methionine synthase I